MGDMKFIKITDLSVCLEILKDFSGCLNSLHQSSQDELLLFANKFIKSGNFVIVQNGVDETMGFIAYYANDCVGKNSFISMIAVHPQFRQMHVGSALIDFCVLDSIAKGMTSVKLEVSKCNVNAQFFYTKKGFVEIGEATSTSLFFKKKCS